MSNFEIAALVVVVWWISYVVSYRLVSRWWLRSGLDWTTEERWMVRGLTLIMGPLHVLVGLILNVGQLGKGSRVLIKAKEEA